MTAYEKVLDLIKPKLILELGSDNFLISTAIFIKYIRREGGQLDSVNIKVIPESFADFSDIWTITQQSNTLNVLSMCADKYIRYDLIFIDTSRSYIPTIAEMFFASKVTDSILINNALSEGDKTDSEKGGVKRAIEEWIKNYPEWKRVDLQDDNIALLTKE